MKESYQSFCIPETFIFHLFLLSNYSWNVTLTPNLTEKLLPTPNSNTNPCILQLRVSGGGQCVRRAL